MATTKKKTAKSSTALFPLPAAIHRGDDGKKQWVVAADPQGRGLTDVPGRRMFIPAGDSVTAFSVRTHEMLHAALSPEPPDGMDDALKAAEDGRIETIAQQQGLGRPASHTGEEVSKAIAAAASAGFDKVALLAVASTGAPHEPYVRAALEKMGLGPVAGVMDWAREVYLDDPSFDSAVAVAEYLRQFSAECASGGGGSKPFSHGVAFKAAAGSLERAVQDGQMLVAHAPLPPSHAAPPPPPVRETRIPGRPLLAAKAAETANPVPDQTLPVPNLKDLVPVKYRLGGAYDWGEPRVEAPPRPVRVAQTQHGSGRSKPTDWGTTPKRMYRTALDNKVFAARKHRRQGTVLIDHSGSMSLRGEDVQRLIENAPAGVIATYSGYGGGVGVIRVVAAGGRMVDRYGLGHPAHGLNEIDGPAIEWLARQRTPRIWVSDFGITGTDDGPLFPELMEAFDRTLLRARIKVINPRRITRTLEEAKHPTGLPGYPEGHDWVDEVCANLR